MKPNRLSVLLLLIPLALFFQGCASKSATKAPNADLTALKSFYVVKLPKDERGINKVIAEQLTSMGYQAATGEEAAPAAPVDAIVTYQDRWMWDITMYMIELQLQVRAPSTQMVLASGKSFRPSLQRASPPEMVKEVLTSVLQQK